jgi:hypothetical protein
VRPWVEDEVAGPVAVISQLRGVSLEVLRVMVFSAYPLRMTPSNFAAPGLRPMLAAENTSHEAERSRTDKKAILTHAFSVFLIIYLLYLEEKA